METKRMGKNTRKTYTFNRTSLEWKRLWVNHIPYCYHTSFNRTSLEWKLFVNNRLTEIRIDF